MAYWVEFSHQDASGEAAIVLIDLDKACRIEINADKQRGALYYDNVNVDSPRYLFDLQNNKRLYELVVEYVKSLEVKR